MHTDISLDDAKATFEKVFCCVAGVLSGSADGTFGSSVRMLVVTLMETMAVDQSMLQLTDRSVPVGL
jgi:hypothetical protein